MKRPTDRPGRRWLEGVQAALKGETNLGKVEGRQIRGGKDLSTPKTITAYWEP